MNFLKNFMVVLAIVGVLTRISRWICFKKNITPTAAAYISFVSIGLLFSPIVAIVLGFDVMVTEFVISLIIWLIADLLWIQYKKQGT